MAMGIAAFRSVFAACAVAAALLGCGDPAPDEPEAPTPAPETPAPAPPAPAPPAPAPPAPPPAAPAPPPATRPVPVPAPAPAPAPAPSAPATPATPAAEAQISLEELGARIKATPAIGTFTKLALKNDIDDLVDALRGYHERHEGDLDDLHQRYEALVLKLLALLEEDEPELALALARSREDIWSRLVNPVEFAKLPT
jgi:hypothetical protein